MYNTILVFLIFPCVQIVHLPAIHIYFPLRLGHVLLAGAVTPSALLYPNNFLDGLVIVTIFIMGIGAGVIKTKV